MSLILLTGDRHQGKTTACLRLAEVARELGRTVGGIVSSAVFQEDRCIGYDATDLATDRSTPLARIGVQGVERVGQFGFLAEGLTLGKAALESVLTTPPNLAMVDEVGPLEFSGGGWVAYLDELATRKGLTLFTVRRSLAGDSARRWAAELTVDLAFGQDEIVKRVQERLKQD